MVAANRIFGPIDLRQTDVVRPVYSEQGWRNVITSLLNRPGSARGTTVLLARAFTVTAPLLLPSGCDGVIVRASSKFDMRAKGVVDALFHVAADNVVIEGVRAQSGDTDYVAGTRNANRFQFFVTRPTATLGMHIRDCRSFCEKFLVDTVAHSDTHIFDCDILSTHPTDPETQIELKTNFGSIMRTYIGMVSNPGVKLLAGSNSVQLVALDCVGVITTASGGNNRLAAVNASTRTLHATDVDADSSAVAAHAASHQNGGGDEISVAGLSGELADPQPPKTHATSHQPGGTDAMAVDAAAATGSLRTIGTTATSACAGNDARLSDDRTASGLRSATTVVSVSAATAPTSGQVLTATGASAATWQTPSSGWTTVTKVTTENRTSTTALANDAALTFAMAASTTYRIRGVIFAEAHATPDFKWGLAGPAATRVAVHIVEPGTFAGVPSLVATGAAYPTGRAILGAGAGKPGVIIFDVVVENGGSGGTFAFQWAQNVSDANNATVFKGSYIEYAVVA